MQACLIDLKSRNTIKKQNNRNLTEPIAQEIEKVKHDEAEMSKSDKRL